MEQYVRAAGRFVSFLAGREPRREHVLAYKEQLEQRFRPSSCNGALTAVNRFLSFLGKEQCRVRLCRVQRSSFRSERRELNRAGYGRLLEAASRRGDVRLCLLMQTLCGMGLRVSEHRFVTAESLRAGWVRVQNKGKLRAVPIPAPLRRELRRYCREQGISSGPVFITKHGNPLDRSVRVRGRRRAEGVPAQPAPSLRPHVLPEGEGHRAPGRPARPFQHRDGPHLHAGQRRVVQPRARTPQLAVRAQTTIKKPHNKIRIM